MSAYSVIPDSPTWDDIRDTLNSGGGSVSNYGGDAYSSKANINPFSKYKPVKLGDIPFTRNNTGTFIVDIATRPGLTIKDHWWRSLNGMCGFNIPQAKVASSQNEKDDIWSYDVPGSNDYYRIEDYFGYYRDATYKLFSVSLPEQMEVNKGFAVTVNFPALPSGNLTLADIFSKAVSGNDPTFVLRVMPANSPEQFNEKEFVYSQGNVTVQLSDGDVTFSGNAANKRLMLHLYAKNVIGRVVSLRTHEDTATKFFVTLISSEPYTFTQPVGNVLVNPSDSYAWYLWNVTFGISAVGYKGGTLPAGSRLVMYQYKTLSTDYTREIALWESSNAPAITVKSGESSKFPLDERLSIRVTNAPSGIRSCIIIWWDSANRELSRGVFTLQPGTLG